MKEYYIEVPFGSKLLGYLTFCGIDAEWQSGDIFKVVMKEEFMEEIKNKNYFKILCEREI